MLRLLCHRGQVCFDSLEVLVTAPQFIFRPLLIGWVNLNEFRFHFQPRDGHVAGAAFEQIYLVYGPRNVPVGGLAVQPVPGQGFLWPSGACSGWRVCFRRQHGQITWKFSRYRGD